MSITSNIDNKSVTKILRNITIVILILIVGILVLLKGLNDELNKYPVEVFQDMFINPVDLDPIDYGLSFYGLHEKLPGGVSNPKVLSFYEKFSGNWNVTNSDVAWCSAWMNSVYASCGYTYSGKLNARSWCDVGIHVDKPMIGDVVVLWRDSRDSWKGHVGIYINEDEKYVYLLGGNQSNQVQISRYPKYRILEYRRMIKSNNSRQLFIEDVEDIRDTLKLAY